MRSDFLYSADSVIFLVERTPHPFIALMGVKSVYEKGHFAGRLLLCLLGSDLPLVTAEFCAQLCCVPQILFILFKGKGFRGGDVLHFNDLIPICIFLDA